MSLREEKKLFDKQDVNLDTTIKIWLGIGISLLIFPVLMVQYVNNTAFIFLLYFMVTGIVSVLLSITTESGMEPAVNVLLVGPRSKKVNW